MSELRSGEKVYFDSFSGIVKGIYLERLSDGKLQFKVTSTNNKVYKTGEVLITINTRLFARQFCKIVHKSGITHLRIIPSYYMFV